MIKESYVNTLMIGLLLAIPLWALSADEPFTITLMTRAVIFAIAAVGYSSL